MVIQPILEHHKSAFCIALCHRQLRNSLHCARCVFCGTKQQWSVSSVEGTAKDIDAAADEQAREDTLIDESDMEEEEGFLATGASDSSL